MAEFDRIELAPDYSISRIISGCWQIAPDHGGGAGTHFRDITCRVCSNAGMSLARADVFCADGYRGADVRDYNSRDGCRCD